MAEYQVTYWRDIPAMVTARAGRRNTAKVELPARFQLVIDEVAMRLNMVGTDAYLEQWRRSPWQEREGTPDEVVKAVAAAIEIEYPPSKLGEILAQATPAKEIGI